jgi:hypothetical protein
MNFSRTGLIDLLSNRRCALQALRLLPFTQVHYETDWYCFAGQDWTLLSCDAHGIMNDGTRHRLEVLQDGTNHYLPKQGEQ